MARETTRSGNRNAYRYGMSDGSLAYSSVQPRRRDPASIEREDIERRRVKRAPHRKFSVIRFMKQNLFFPKLFAVGCIAAVAAVAFFTVIRFAKIASIQASINDIGKRIESTQKKIDELSIGTQSTGDNADFASSIGLIPPKP